MTDAPYPVRLRARREESLSRWLWLVKIVLVLPHFVVLTFLWLGECIVVLAAAISVTAFGRQPAALFRYSLGVLRWTWRVTYYSVGGFATDRYPPFSLQPDPAYPADLDAPLPGRQSRGLAFVRWILIIPQLLVVALLVGGLGFHTEGLILVLALIGALALLFTGSYPSSLLDIVVALQRWVFRVGAYALLVTDAYPPFRLDFDEPADATGDEPAGSEESAADTEFTLS